MRLRKATGVVLAGSLLALTGCMATGPGGSSDAVVFGTTGGAASEAFQKAWLLPFTEETGIPVVEDAPATMAKMLQSVDANAVTMDAILAVLSTPADANPALEELDYDIIDAAQFEDSPFKVRPQAVPFFVFSRVAAYNTELFPEGSEPTGFMDFFDTENFPGKRLMPAATSGWSGFLELALIHDGVPRDELYPLDVERALRVFEPVKADLDVMADDGECVTEVAAGEAAMGACYNGRTEIGKRDGLPIDIAWGNEMQWADYLFIPKGAKNKDKAMELIAYLVDKENNGRIADEIAYAPANPLAEVDPDGEWVNAIPGAGALEGELAPIVPDEEWWMENQAAVAERIAAWLQS
ncbi:extracellular solute-binding protein [Microbacterium lushaniae]|uniref:Extracellular solute-binding protein n=1 Tax=Microbacterium lushaniae TaxID=2614639 RepID=A0A5J6KZL0_9MICO|nr:extracellular solute-binding protein [Microbacterium lushaniae]QEW01645.1 extracellular solute-binding protein [Microbacterium lushaniae]